MAGKRVLITGRHGFTGRYVARELGARGWDVWGLSTHAPALPDPQHLVADLTCLTSLSETINHIVPDAVVHLAAQAFVAHDAPDQFYSVNLMGTRNLLQVLSDNEHGQDGVIVASSANIYGMAETPVLDERAPACPANDYAVSKLASEHVAKLFQGRLPIVITRPFNYTGQGQSEKFLVSKIAAHFRRKAPEIHLGNLDVARDFSDVRDVAQAYGALLEDIDPGRIVNICSGQATSLKDILRMCADISGHTLDVSINPAFVRENEIKTLRGDPGQLEHWLPSKNRRTFLETLTWMLEIPQ